MADASLLFPSGKAYSDLSGRVGVKLLAVDDTTNPAAPQPGYVKTLAAPAASVTNGTINNGGHLVLSRSDGTQVDVGSVLGPAGPGFTSASVNSSGHLLLVRTDGTVLDLGVVVGANGKDGAGGGGGGGNGNLLYRGTWTGSTTYAVNDVVRNLGQTFICSVAHTSTTKFDGSKFDAIGAKGGYGAAYYVQDYGGRADGVTDDTNAWTNLIADVTAVGRGCIMLTGMSICAPGIIKLPAFTSIFGGGLHTGVRWRDNSSGPFLIDISGANQNSISGYNTLSNFTMSGGQGGNAHLLRVYYNAHSEITNLFGDSASIGFMDAVQFWDSTVRDLQLNYCGTGEFTKSIWIRNSGAASGTFGYSSDTSNQLVLQRIRCEDFFGSALWIEKGPSNGYPSNGITVDFFKAETNNAISQPAVYLGDGAMLCTLLDIYISINGRAGGSAAIDGLVNVGGGSNTLHRIRVTQNAPGLVNRPINHAASGVDHYADLVFTGAGGALKPAAAAVLCVTGGTQPVLTGFVNSFPMIQSTSGYTAPSSGGGTISGVSIDGSAILASIASPYQMQATDRVIDVNKGTGAATKLLLPANPTLWVEYTVIDGKGDAGTNNITVAAANGTTINGQPSFTLKANNDAITFRAVSATVWRIT